MNQKIKNLANSISILKKELTNTKQLLSEKEKELESISICDHSKLDKAFMIKKDIEWPKFTLPCPKNESCVCYRCDICGTKIFRDEEDPELEKRVIK